MAHHHHHHTHQAGETSTWRLMVTMILNFVITIAEVIGGLVSGSLSLISDALHNFSDGIAIIISYFAIRLNRRPKNMKYTFGYKRAEILAAVFNASVLIGISLYLFVEAYHRFVDPGAISGGLMSLVATVGLLANVAGTLLLRPGAADNMNIRSAYLHLLSDALSSVGVIIGGLAIYFFGISWIDPLLTVLIGIYVLRESFIIVREALDLLMMAAPPEISIPEIEKEVMQLENVSNLHHVHLWRINEKDLHFEAHLETDDIPISRTDQILQKVEHILQEHFGINHVTIQFECQKCQHKNLV